VGELTDVVVNVVAMHKMNPTILLSSQYPRPQSRSPWSQASSSRSYVLENAEYMIQGLDNYEGAGVMIN